MERKMSTTQEQKVLLSKWEEYRGKHVLVYGKKIYAADTGREALEILKKIEKKNPKASPLLAYVPKAETLILILRL